MVHAAAVRVASAGATLVAVTLLVFVLINLAPGGPLESGTDDDDRGFTRAMREEISKTFRLDRPLIVRYAAWVRDAARGDLGTSFRDRRPVRDKIREVAPVTIALNGIALAVMIVVAVPLGAAAAGKPGSRIDRWTAAATFALHALPVFWVAVVLQGLFASRWGLLPLFGTGTDGSETWGLAARAADRAAHLVLPCLCLAYGGIAYLARFVRATLLESGGAETARAARARGLTGLAVLVRHGFRQAAVPMLTLAGVILPRLVGGSLLVETVFGIRGLGTLFTEAILSRDLPVVLGLTLLSGAAVVAATTLADLTYAVADPRTRRGA